MNKMTIPEYYRGKTILVTGASGFIGKVLLWKLLDSCPNVDTIYILVRPKRSKTVQVRLDDILQTPIFDKFKKENPSILNKIEAVAGDVCLDRMGLSEEDEEKLVHSVNLIFHIAATVRFDSNLKDAVEMNVEGTLNVLEFATKMSNLKALVHTSTMYCHCDLEKLEEKAYTTNETPQQVMNLVKWMGPEMLDAIEEKLIAPHPNTYTYSKRLAETLVVDYFPKLPIAIARPSIVIPSVREPMTGWIDNKNGIVGILLASGTGVLRVVWCNTDYHPDVIPVDIVCNGLIAVAWKTGRDTQRPAEIPVYNLGELEMKPVTFGEIEVLATKIGHQYPFSKMLWYPGGCTVHNDYLYRVLTFLWQWIPAYLVDGIIFILGYKTFLVQVQHRIHHGMKVYNYFARRPWNFEKHNILRVREELAEEDKQTFKLTNEGVNVEDFFLDAHLFARWYLMKDDPSNLPAARFKLKIFYILHCFVKFVSCFFMGWLFLRLVFL